jgi:hypothetical protein
MLRVQYYIGTKTLEDITTSLYEYISPDDVLCATTSAAWGTNGNDVIILSKTQAGVEFLTFMVLKWSHLKDFVLDEIPDEKAYARSK